ncbi:MAG: S8 family peptidase, partial [Coriobacteriales bacterium]
MSRLYGSSFRSKEENSSVRTRPRRMVIAFVITAVLSSSAPVFAHVTSGPPSDVCEVVVRLENGAGPAVRAVLARRRLNVKKETYKGRGLLVRVPPGRSAEEVAAELSSLDGVSIATPNGRVRALWTPSDSLHPQQWGMGAIQMPAAWDIERGDSAVTVAVIDTGAQLDHPDLAGNLDIASDYDFADDDNTADDTNGHGTHVCGIIAAVTDNATGVAGVAPGVRVLPLKIIDESGYGSISDLADAIMYATDHGADVVNMSLGEALDLTRPSDAAQAQYMQEAIDYAFTRDVVLIAAAGNASEGATSVFYPAACDGVIAVAATARSGEVASYSCYGPEVDIAAPGGDGTIRQNLIISTFLGSAYQYMQGTSMASPHVAGAAALLRSHVATASASRVANALVYSAADISPEGWDEHSGHGLLQVASALEDLHIPSPSVERLA